MAKDGVILVKGKFKVAGGKELSQKLKKELPIILANNTRNHFRRSFERGGKQTDASRGGWKGRAKEDSGRAILVKSGTLRRDINILKESFSNIVIGTSNVTAAYAGIHNDGGKIDITPQMRRFFWAKFYDTKDEFWRNMALTRGNTITIPQREYIGKSRSLNASNKKEIKSTLKELLI